MASLKENLIDTISKDLSSIEDLGNIKLMRKEYSLILLRIKSAKKLFAADTVILGRLDNLEQKVITLKKSL